MQNILVFSGTKQSGKSSAAKYIVGSQMKKAGSIREFEIDNDGNLLVNAFYDDGSGKQVEKMGILDIYRSDLEFMRYASERIWPFCKVYSFATFLKESVIAIFGVNPKYIYGSDEDKNKPTTIKWRDIWELLPLSKKDDILAQKRIDDYLSHRELLQEFGTICRVFKSDCWLASCYNMIVSEGYPNVVIDDGRYENEVDYSNGRNATTVLLTLQPFKDSHSSEKIHSVPRTKFKFVVDNANMTLEQKHSEIDNILLQTGWTTGTLS